MMKKWLSLCVACCSSLLVADDSANLYKQELEVIFEKNYLNAEDASIMLYWISSKVIKEGGHSTSPSELIGKFKEEIKKPEVMDSFLSLYAETFQPEEILEVYDLMHDERYLKYRARLAYLNFESLEATEAVLKNLVADLEQKKAVTSTIVQLTEENFQDIMNASRPVIIDVYTDWCPPCKGLAPIFKELSEQYGQDYLFAKLNAEEQERLSQQLGIRGFPTIIFLKNGKEVGRQLGFMNKEKFIAKIKEFLGS